MAIQTLQEILGEKCKQFETKTSPKGRKKQILNGLYYIKDFILIVQNIYRYSVSRVAVINQNKWRPQDS